MAADTDALLDRRRLKRRLTLWRLLAITAVVMAVIAFTGDAEDLLGRPYVARISVSDIIFDDAWRDRVIADIAKDDEVKALIVRIHSPGGTVVGGESLYLGLRAVARNKPVIAVIGELGTSAAYMTALGADRIIARTGSITGSIGAILQTTDVTGLLEKLGIKPEAIKSGPLKAEPNPFEPMTEQTRSAIRAVVMDVFGMFVELVEKRRKLPREAVLELADGRIFTGRQALAEGLIDGLGGESDARDWLAETHGISASLPVKEVNIDQDEEFWPDLVDGLVGKALFSERLRLDGLVSLWHPVLR